MDLKPNKDNVYLIVISFIVFLIVFVCKQYSIVRTELLKTITERDSLQKLSVSWKELNDSLLTSSNKQYYVNEKIREKLKIITVDSLVYISLPIEEREIIFSRGTDSKANR